MVTGVLGFNTFNVKRMIDLKARKNQAGKVVVNSQENGQCLCDRDLVCEPHLISIADASAVFVQCMQRLSLRWAHVIANISTENMVSTR